MSAELTIAPRAGRALIATEALQQEAEQRRLLGEYVRSQMVEGTDYGTIPGTANKTLLKPGAEKLTQLYRCIPRFTIEEKTENWETGLFYYRFSCQIVTQADDAVVAEGVGSCSTFESRYRWRQSNRKCPACGVEAILRSKFPPKEEPDSPPGWYCFAKKGGCNAQFDANDPGIIDQPIGRVQNPDIIDQVNTVLKMAKKRALVDASIALARCSDIFTQDMEDHIDDAPPVRQQPAKPAAIAQPKPEPAKPKLSLAEAKKQILESFSLGTLRALSEALNQDRHLYGTEEWKELVVNIEDRKFVLSHPEGEQGAGFPVTGATAAANHQTTATATSTTSTSEPVRTMPSAERRTRPQPGQAAGADVAASVASLLGKATGLDWTQVRDDRLDDELKPSEAGGIAKHIGFAPRKDLRIHDLTAAQQLKLYDGLAAVAKEKEARAERRREKAGAV